MTSGHLVVADNDVASVPTGSGGRRGHPALRSGAIVAGLGLATTLPCYAFIADQQSEGTSAAALAMSSMHMTQMSVFWAFPVLQATGIAALVWAYVGVVLGLLESGRRAAWWPLARAQTDRLHRQISLLVIGLTLVHAFATSLDAMGDNLLTSFVPYQESWGAAVWGYNSGIFALYLAILVGPTYYLRRHFGARRWRFAHRFALVVYILAVWHTLLLGADVAHYGWVRPFIWLMQIPLLVLFARRLTTSSRGTPRLSQAARATFGAIRYGLAGLSSIAVVAIVAVVATGNSGFIARV